MTTPTVGRDVHYVARGSADGRFPSVCRAAKVTEIDPDDTDVVGLCVINPTGFFFHSLGDGGCGYDEGVPADEPEATGALCNAGERRYPGGSWHWPERVPE